MKVPFFSIIVVSYNAASVIEATIESILGQTNDDYEIIVKDGGSDDGTLECVPQNDKIKIYSNADDGIYYGMNEAIDYAVGEYVCFLNCGDRFASNEVLHDMYDFLKAEKCGVAYGNYSRKKMIGYQPSKLNAFDLYRTPLCHQTMFIERRLFETFGKYDITFKICADWAHSTKLFLNGVSFLHCPLVVCDYEGGGASESENGIRIKKEETERIRREYYAPEQQIEFNKKINRSFYHIRQRMVSDKAPSWVRRFYRGLVKMYNMMR